MSKALAAAGWVFGASLAVGYALGCTSSGEDPPASGDQLALAGAGKDFCERTIGALTGAMAACCTAGDQSTPEYGLVQTFTVGLVPRCTSALEASIDRRRVRINPAEVDACHAAYAATYGGGEKCKSLTATFSDPAGPSCRNAFSGVQAAGAPCMGDQECQAGLTCVGFSSAGEGTCQTPPAVGAPCGPGRTDSGSSSVFSFEFGSHPKCAAGAFCASNGTCAPRIAAGQDCTFSEESNECMEGLRCHMRKCSAEGPSGPGGACVSSADCNGGYYCARSGSANGQCTELKPAGGSCTGAFGFQTECKGRCDAKGGESGTCATFCGSL